MGFEGNHLKQVRFIWDIHYKCNYQCPYCWFYDSWDTLSINDIYPPLEEWTRAWDRIYDLYGESHIEITGGEPFIYPDFYQLLEQLSAKHKIRVTTNLSINKELLCTLSDKLDNKRVNFEISFHPLFTQIDNFLEKAVILKKKGFCKNIQFVAYPPQINMIPYFENRVKQEGLIFSVTAFWGTDNNKSYPKSYSPDEKEMLKNYIKDINRIMFNLEGTSSRGKMCYAGNKFALIRGNGDVVRCGQSKPDDVIGNFLDNNFFLNREPLPCAYDFCPCNDYTPASCEDNAQLQMTCTSLSNEHNNVDSLGDDGNTDFAMDEERNGILSKKEKDLQDLSCAEKNAALMPVEFSWEICYTCNYRCPYCGRWNDTSTDDLYLDVLEWERVWRGIYEKYGSCNMFISGAEPSTYPGFFEIVQKIAAMHTITICTNFSWSAEEILDRNFSPQRVQVTPTYHSLFADFETFLTKAVILKQWIKDKLIFFVAYPPQMAKVDYYKKIMNENGLNFCIVPLRGSKNGAFGVVTCDDDKDKIGSITDMSDDEYAYLAQKSSPRGKPCRAGNRYAFIKATGKVFPCSQSNMCLGNIRESEFILLKEPSVCTFDFCPYESYNLLERYKLPNDR